MKVQNITVYEKDGPKWSSLPMIREPDVRKLYHVGYWDGPHSGVCEVDGKRLWFQQRREESVQLELEPSDDKFESDPEESDDNYDWSGFRFMALYELTAEEWKTEGRLYGAWRKYVGRHCEYDAEGKFRDRDDVGNESGGPCDWDSYHAAIASLPKRPALSKRTPVGYFILWSSHDPDVRAMADEWLRHNEPDR